MTTTQTSSTGVNAAALAAKDTAMAPADTAAGAPAPVLDQTSASGTEDAAGPTQGEGEGPAAPFRGDAVITVTAYGTPVPQGSISSLGKGRPAVHSNAKRLKPWRKAIRQATADVMLGHDQLDGPLRVDLLFAFDRPAAHWRTGANAHRLRDRAPVRPSNRGSGDVDKLSRAVLDALTDAGLYGDDSQVVDLRALKRWAGDEESLRQPGVHIVVREVTR